MGSERSVSTLRAYKSFCTCLLGNYIRVCWKIWDHSKAFLHKESVSFTIRVCQGIILENFERNIIIAKLIYTKSLSVLPYVSVRELHLGMLEEMGSQRSFSTHRVCQSCNTCLLGNYIWVCWKKWDHSEASLHIRSVSLSISVCQGIILENVERNLIIAKLIYTKSLSVLPYVSVRELHLGMLEEMGLQRSYL